MRKKMIYIPFIISVVLLVIYWDIIKELITLLQNGNLETITSKLGSYPFAPLASILLMILQSVVAPIPSFLITGANGAIFGLFWGVVISWIGAMGGAFVTFYLARIFGEPLVRKLQKHSGLLQKVEEINQKHGVKIIFIGRLLPFISFDFLSYAAGLSTMKATGFFLATAIGMLPGTILYVVIGSTRGTVLPVLFITFIIYILYKIYKHKKGDTQNETKV